MEFICKLRSFSDWNHLRLKKLKDEMMNPNGMIFIDPEMEIELLSDIWELFEDGAGI